MKTTFGKHQAERQGNRIAGELLKVAKSVIAGDRKLVFRHTFPVDILARDMPKKTNAQNLWEDEVYTLASVINNRLIQNQILKDCETETKAVGTNLIDVLPSDDGDAYYVNIHLKGSIDVQVFVPWFNESKLQLFVENEIRKFITLRK